jgi:hypothetical protein
MAWPKSPLTAYIANNVPVIKADDLNAFQDWINALTNNTVSILGLGIDGVGGLGVLPEPGSVRWTNTAPGRGNPPSATALLNEIRALTTPKLWARVLTDGAGAVDVKDGANIFTCTRQPNDVLRFGFSAGMANAHYGVTFSGCALDSGGNPHTNFYMIDGDLNPAFFDVHCGTFKDGPDGGTVIDPMAWRVHLMVHVFGRQDS